MILIPPKRDPDMIGYKIDVRNKEGPVVLAYLNNNNAIVSRRGRNATPCSVKNTMSSCMVK